MVSLRSRLPSQGRLAPASLPLHLATPPPPGGVSPVTRDFVNPERPWPHLGPLAAATAAAGKLLLPRLPVYPAHLLDLSAAGGPAGPAGASRWLSGAGGARSVGAAARRAADSAGLLRASGWCAGAAEGTAAAREPAAAAVGADAAAATTAALAAADAPLPAAEGAPPPAARQPASPPPRPRPGALWSIAVGADGALEGAPAPGGTAPEVAALLERVLSGAAASTSGAAGGPAPRPRGASEAARALELSEAEIELLLRARGPDFSAVVAAADELRRRVCGDEVTYVVNRCGAGRASRGRVICWVGARGRRRGPRASAAGRLSWGAWRDPPPPPPHTPPSQQHQLHQRVHLQLQLLRLQQGVCVGVGGGVA
jgi:hypothetical protein